MGLVLWMPFPQHTNAETGGATHGMDMALLEILGAILCVGLAIAGILKGDQFFIYASLAVFAGLIMTKLYLREIDSRDEKQRLRTNPERKHRR
jgi:hypothetical protein